MTLRTSLAFALASMFALSACKGSEPPPAETYRVRAQVESLEGTGDAARVILEHEAIETFKNREGEVERMPAMKMAFGVGPGVDAAAFTPGSKHEVSFDVVWGREPTIRVIEAKRLPDDTALTLGEHK